MNTIETKTKGETMNDQEKFIREVMQRAPGLMARINGARAHKIDAETAKEIVQDLHDKAKAILAALGEEIYVSNERHIDMATAVSGSGPAYFFLIMESLIDASVHIGLPRDLAEKLVVQTMLGATRLAQETGKTPSELRNMVTSPGGTTAEGLLQLEEGGLRAILAHAIIAGYDKAIELGG